MLFRLILLLAIVGGLVLFTWSNLQPLPLIFLGIQLPAFPLAFWVLGAIGAGVLTTLLINILYSLSHYAAGRAVRSQFRKNERRNRFQDFRRNPFQPNAARLLVDRPHQPQRMMTPFGRTGKGSKNQ